jgi:hypothetical protein
LSRDLPRSGSKTRRLDSGCCPACTGLAAGSRQIAGKRAPTVKFGVQTMDDRIEKAKSVSSRPKTETSGGLGPCRSVACPAIYRAAVAKPEDSILPDTPHAQVLLPVPGRSSGCGPDTSHVPTIWSGVWTLDQSHSRQTARIRDRRNPPIAPTDLASAQQPETKQKSRLSAASTAN